MASELICDVCGSNNVEQERNGDYSETWCLDCGVTVSEIIEQEIEENNK